MNNLQDRVIGCVVGCAIGDAMGGPYEGREPPFVVTTEPTDWRLSDDTQLTLATCEAILAAGRPEPQSIAASFRRWHRARRIDGMGASTFKALEDLEVGSHWALSGSRGERAAGNGAAMRIAPIAFLLDPSVEVERATIRDICRITHHNDEAYVGALAMVIAIRAAMNEEWPGQSDTLACIAQRLPDTNVRDRLMEAHRLTGMSVTEAATVIGTSGYVAESVPFALFAAKQLRALGFEGMLSELISAGGDTDTNAAMAGAVAGAALGISRLPEILCRAIPEREDVLNIATAFAHLISAPGNHGRPMAP